jgi:hypothetical protein
MEIVNQTTAVIHAPLQQSRERVCEQLNTITMPQPSLRTEDHSSSLSHPSHLSLTALIPSSHPLHITTPPPPPLPCCNCHSRHARSNQKDYLSCLDVNRGRALDDCECKGDCPPGCCQLQQCVRSHKAGVRQRETGDSQQLPARRITRKRSRSTTHSPPRKRTTSQHPSHPSQHPSHDARRGNSGNSSNGSSEIDRGDETDTTLNLDSDSQTAALEQKYDDSATADCQGHVDINTASASSPLHTSTPPAQLQTHRQNIRTRRSDSSAALGSSPDTLSLSILQEHEAAARQLNRERRQLHQSQAQSSALTHNTAAP